MLRKYLKLLERQTLLPPLLITSTEGDTERPCIAIGENENLHEQNSTSAFYVTLYTVFTYVASEGEYFTLIAVIDALRGRKRLS